MRWQEVIKDPRYINALPEQQKLIKQDWFKKNIETDPRYKPELRDKLWYRVFNEPEIRSDVTIAKSELAKLPLKSLEISHPKPGVIHKEELTPYEIKQRQGENQKLLNEWYEKYGKALTKEELANMGIEITKQVVNSYKPMKTGEKLTKLPEHKIGLYQALQRVVIASTIPHLRPERLAEIADINKDDIFYDVPWEDLPFSYHPYFSSGENIEEEDQSKSEEKYPILVKTKRGVQDIALLENSIAFYISRVLAHIIRVYTFEEYREKLAQAFVKMRPELEPLVWKKNQDV